MSSITVDVEKQVRIPIGSRTLGGILAIPHDARSVVVFAHGRGSSRFSPRNNFVAEVLRVHGFGVLLMDLLAAAEDTSQKRMDVNLLANRLLSARQWLKEQQEFRELTIGLFGTDVGAAAALKVAARPAHEIAALVCRNARLDLIEEDLPKVSAPTLLIVGGKDPTIMDLNRKAFQQLRCTKSLEIVEGATPLFEESSTLEQVAYLANDWFKEYLSAGST